MDALEHAKALSSRFSTTKPNLTSIRAVAKETSNSQEIAAADRADQWQFCDWLIAKALMYQSSLKKEALKWISEKSSIKQRIFWSVRARSVRAEDHEVNQELPGFLEQIMALEEENISAPPTQMRPELTCFFLQ